MARAGIVGSANRFDLRFCIGVWSPNNHLTKFTNTFSVATACGHGDRSIAANERISKQVDLRNHINKFAITKNKNWQMVLYILQLQKEMYDCVLEDKHGQRICNLLFRKRGCCFSWKTNKANLQASGASTVREEVNKANERSQARVKWIRMWREQITKLEHKYREGASRFSELQPSGATTMRQELNDARSTVHQNRAISTAHHPALPALWSQGCWRWQCPVAAAGRPSAAQSEATLEPGASQWDLGYGLYMRCIYIIFRYGISV